ncbi:MAG: PIG-L family deacetylase [Hyphomicrobiaceae bacterium]|nr:PIG-L family deacetylase [Hyphomicrobiaceae bacterium]
MSACRAFASCLAALLAVLPASPVVGEQRAGDGHPTAPKVAIYVSAHPDDWQLFMNPPAFDDAVQPGTRIVIVYVTAGDGGQGVGTGGRRHPFYLARERGAEDAVRFMADVDGLPARAIETRPVVNGHAIRRVEYRDTTSYFLRLPDGNLTGSGYARTGRQSLQRLADGAIGELQAIDGSTAYRGWGDLVATLRRLVDLERAGGGQLALHLPDGDPVRNAGDHSDHLLAGRAMLEAASGLTCAERNYYVDYASAKLPENLEASRRDLKAAVFAVTAAGIRAMDHTTNWRWYRSAYLGRSYRRTEPASGPCSEPAARDAFAHRPVGATVP